MPKDIASKKFVILMTCVVKDDDKFYPQLFSEYVLYMYNGKHAKKDT